jgi:hypothetical protein
MTTEVHQLLHRLWVEGGGNPDLKVGEVTEQNVADLVHGLKKLADEAIFKEDEESVMRVKDVNGDPALEMYDKSGHPVIILMSEVANFIAKNAPFASAVLKHSVDAWKNLKISGRKPV